MLAAGATNAVAPWSLAAREGSSQLRAQGIVTTGHDEDSPKGLWSFSWTSRYLAVAPASSAQGQSRSWSATSALGGPGRGVPYRIVQAKSVKNWPFDDSPDTAVLTTQAVVAGEWIFQVSRDEDDGMWQFHTPSGDDELSEEDGRIVSLHFIWQTDPSVAEVADLAPGWVAWRVAFGAPWSRMLRNSE